MPYLTETEYQNATLKSVKDSETIAELLEALDKIEAVTKHLMLTDGYKEERDWLGQFIFTIQDIAIAAKAKGQQS